MSEHHEFEELVALEALRALDAADQARLDAHLASGCERCESDLRDARRVAGQLVVAAAAPSAPSAHVRETLMKRVHHEKDGDVTPEAGRTSLWPMLAAAAGLVAAIAAGFYARSLEISLADETARREAAEAELNGLRDSFASITSPQNRAISLNGLEAAPSARATAFLDPANRRLFLYVDNLPALPPGRTYQIWLLVDGTPVSVGTFDVGADGSARLDGEPLPEFDGSINVAVTEEPAGGVPQPTGAMVLLGS